MTAHLFTWLALLLLVSAGTEPVSADFIPLGHLPGGSSSDAQAVSADGMVAVGNSNSALSGPVVEEFRWTQATGMVGLGFPPGSRSSFAGGVSADGSIVVGTIGSDNVPFDEAFRWTQASGMVRLGFLPGGNQSEANGVSADGAVVVGWSNFPGGAQQAFRWTQGIGAVGLGFLPGGGGLFGSQATAVSANGSVVVGASIIPFGPGTGVDEAFRWTQATGMVGLGFLPGGSSSTARGVSADGAVIVGASNYSLSGPQAFRWTQATGMVGLGFLPGGSLSIAQGVSADGAVVVGSSGGGVPSEAFIWTDTSGMQSLRDVLVSQGDDLTGWRLTQASGISADGTTIVGLGINPSGQTEAWLASLALQLTVALDVKPGGSENAVNPKSKGVIPVAILSTNSFDASTIDQASLRFGLGQALAEGSGHLEDVNGDGQLDLVLHFRTQDSGIQCGDTSVSITGQTLNGIPIQGSDSITTVGCMHGNQKKK